MSETNASPQTIHNQAFLLRAKEQGRKSIRGILSDKKTSDQYVELTKCLPKKKLGLLLSAMVKLAHEAKENGNLVIDEDSGTVLLNGKAVGRQD